MQDENKTVQKVRWHLMLEKIRDKSFRRQYRLGAAKANWIFSKEDKVEDHLNDRGVGGAHGQAGTVYSRRRYNHEVLL